MQTELINRRFVSLSGDRPPPQITTHLIHALRDRSYRFCYRAFWQAWTAAASLIPVLTVWSCQPP
jgi:hypothetical protein